MPKIRLGIIDDHTVVLDGLRSMLQAFPDLEIVWTTQSGKELLQLMKETMADVILMDIQMPEINGIELCQQVVREHPGVNVIAFSSFDDSNYVKQLFGNGARGYLLKNSDKQTIVKAIEKVMAGEEYIDEALRSSLHQETLTGQRRSLYDIPLTKREKEILKLIVNGDSNQMIADKLFISLRTVETHRLNIHQKLNVKNTAGLLKEAMRRGLVEKI